LYIWNLKRLIKVLKEEDLTDKDMERYYWMGIAFLLIILGTAFFSVGKDYNLFDFIDNLAFILINAILIYVVYQINLKGKNKNFMIRLLSLSIPIVLRSIILTTIITVVVYLIVILLGLVNAVLEQTNIYDVCITIVGELYYSYLMIKSFKLINE
jgi:hypothetical protein